MRRRLIFGAVVALLALGTACGQAAMSRQDARKFAQRALTSIGFTNVRVSSTVTLANYRTPDRRFRNQKPVQVWRTHSTVATGTVDLYVPRKGNSAVFVRDEAGVGGPLLTDRQFRSLRGFRYNPAQDRRRNDLQVPTIVAVVLAVLAACGLFVAYVMGATDRSVPTPPLEDEGAPPAAEPPEPAPELEPTSSATPS
jgi:hypothetical protein